MTLQTTLQYAHSQTTFLHIGADGFKMISTCSEKEFGLDSIGYSSIGQLVAGPLW